MSIDKNYKSSNKNSNEHQSDEDRIWNGVENKINSHYSKRKQRNLIIKAASILFVLGISSYWIFQIKDTDTSKPHTITFNESINPGTDKATLTNDNGTVLDLTSSSNNSLKEQGVEMMTNKKGEVYYVIHSVKNKKQISYQTISTPRGGQTRVMLPDGSRIILNAESSLRFANNIDQQPIRDVTLSGEGYFSIKKSNNRPFVVNTDRQKIKVLGTQFNVNTYDQSKVLTTLVEGSVQINDKIIITPGQQAVGSNYSSTPTIKNVETDDYLDWVNDQFIFRDESIKSIMSRLSRWYNFDVLYAIGIQEDISFNGEISRYDKVEEILSLLSKSSSLTFKIQGKTILVK